jgi:hypothetical protein
MLKLHIHNSGIVLITKLSRLKQLLEYDIFMSFRENVSHYITKQELHILRAHNGVLRSIYGPRSKHRPSGRANLLTLLTVYIGRVEDVTQEFRKRN